MGSLLGRYLEKPQAEQRSPWVASTIIHDDGECLLKDTELIETQTDDTYEHFAFLSDGDSSDWRSLSGDDTSKP